jgi:hypothetical protein
MSKRTNNVNAASAVLWASAFVIAAMVIIQAGKLPGNEAQAEMAVHRHGFTLLTVDSGRGDDAAPNELLYIIDSRDAMMYVYEIENAQNREILLRRGGNLSNLFATGRR